MFVPPAGARDSQAGGDHPDQAQRARARLATSRIDLVDRLVAGDDIGGARSIDIPDRTDLYQSLIDQADPMSGGVMPGNILPPAHVNGLSSSSGYPDLSGRLHAMLDPSDTMWLNGQFPPQRNPVLPAASAIVPHAAVQFGTQPYIPPQSSQGEWDQARQNVQPMPETGPHPLQLLAQSTMQEAMGQVGTAV